MLYIKAFNVFAPIVFAIDFTHASVCKTKLDFLIYQQKIVQKAD